MDNESKEMFQKLFDKIDSMDQHMMAIDNHMTAIDNHMTTIDSRLDKLDTRMDMMEVIMKRTVKKLDDLQLDVKIAERDIRRDIHDLNDEMETVIEILRMNDMLPR